MLPPVDQDIKTEKRTEKEIESIVDESNGTYKSSSKMYKDESRGPESYKACLRYAKSCLKTHWRIHV